MSSETPILQAVGAGRRATGSNAWLFRGIDWGIQPSQRIALTGPPGSGKTLLLRALAQLDPLDEGEILWNGLPVPDSNIPDFRRHVVYMQQRPTLLEGTVEENLRFPFTLRANQACAWDRQKILECLRLLGRDAEFLSRPREALSGGEAQFVSLLRVLQLEPEVLLLDEPTAALDEAGSQAIEQLVANWWNDLPGTRAWVWITHDARQADRVGQHQAKMAAGQLTTSD